MAASPQSAHIADLKPDPKNARKHTPRNLGQIERSIQTNGFGRSLLLANDGTIVAGNATFDAATQAGIERVRIIDTDGTEIIALRRTDVEPNSKQFKELSIADNRAAELAAWDTDVLADLGDEIDLTQFFMQDELDALLASLEPTEGLTDPDDVPAVPDEPITKPGNLWLLGRHRLPCGDATVTTDVDRLLDGAVPELMITDPPYGVDYDPEWRVGVGGGGKQEKTHGAKIMGGGRADWGDAWSLFPGDVVYVWHASEKTIVTAASLESHGFVLAYHIVWNKDLANFNRGNYHYKHEPCWYAIREGRERHWVGDAKQTTVWDIPTIHSFANGHSVAEWGMVGHANQKPVECMARPLANHTGDVYDPFVGSGTTIIAAEQAGRICYAMDLDPKHIDTAVKRWEQFTGQTAQLATVAMAAD